MNRLEPKTPPDPRSTPVAAQQQPVNAEQSAKPTPVITDYASL